MTETTNINKLYDEIDTKISDALGSLRDQFDALDPECFAGQHQWLIRTNGEDLWVSVETQGTYFEDDCTLASGAQHWDRSSFERGEDESDEDYDKRFAEGCRPEFPNAEAEEFVASRIVSKIRKALDLAE